MRRALGVLAAAALAVATNAASAEDKVLAIVVKGLDNPFFEQINQGCQKANAELARQIVLTATNVAPNLTQLIAECARGVVAGDSTAGKTGKEVKDVFDVQPVNSGSDYAAAPTDIRGAYIIQGGGGSIITTTDCCGECEKRPPPKPEPQSPSNACPKK